MKIIKHCSTRWLSLERCVQRTLQQWPALKSYFQSHAECEKPGRINRCMQYFTSDQMWLYFAFLEFVMPILNDFNVMFQAGESMIGYLHTEMVRLFRKMMGKFVTTSTITAQSDITKVDFRCTDNQHDNTRIAVGMKVREFLSDNDDLPPHTVNNFFSTVREFYCTMTETMIKKFPFQDKVLRGISFLNPLSKNKLSPYEVISLSDRFLNYNQQETSQLEDEAAEYFLTPLCDLPAFDPDTPSLNQFWTSIGNLKLPSVKQQFQHLFALSKVVLALPHSNADTERTFSMLKKIQSEPRDNLADKTIHSLLSVKINNPTDCHQYKPEPELVKAAKSACALYKQSLS
ncbi:uncharacterized protein LOC127710681 [Mytilus californianus]|uniref:uncharacterized protein LOC127710681 n=1 Tax=Mytilus californianus TaxID=6549 RepID=UPI0022463772|nr:uncharacterized protein LOC127710681 [Mytilus californianus]